MIIKQGKSNVTFVFTPTSGTRKVSVVGSFNGWDPAKGEMKRQQDGTFRRKEKLQPGRYEYKFLVDGQWLVDPEAEGRVQNAYGTENSMLAIR
jgi:1,4-alpha-glucan branching enzyme